MSETIWKEIPGYEGIYEASSLGEIRTSEGKTTWSSRFDCPRVWRQRILKQKVYRAKGRTRSDARVTLYKDGNPKDFLVSRLIAETFLGAPSSQMTVNHTDGDSLNNNVSNLEWVTCKENSAHGNLIDKLDFCKKSVCLLNVETGEIHAFKSLSDASKFLGKFNGYISQIIKRGKEPPYPYSFYIAGGGVNE